MSSRNGRKELVSLLQYMKNTTLNNEDIIVKDERILNLNRIVEEVKESEEWEVVEMNILEIGIERGKELGFEQGREQGLEQGQLRTLVKSVELYMKNFGIDLQKACDGLEISVEEYEKAKQKIAIWEKQE